MIINKRQNILNISKRLKFIATPILAFGLLGASMASAKGLPWGTPANKDKATAYQQIKLIPEKGITADQLKIKLQELRIAELKTKLKTLVDKGTITQAQADQRLQKFQTAQFRSKSGKAIGHRGDKSARPHIQKPRN